MESAIKDLWNGSIAPCEHCGAHDPAANELLVLMARNREKLSGGLTAAQMEVFRKYMDCSEEYLLHMPELAFGEGFALGGRLAAEVLL